MFRKTSLYTETKKACKLVIETYIWCKSLYEQFRVEKVNIRNCYSGPKLEKFRESGIKNQKSGSRKHPTSKETGMIYDEYYFSDSSIYCSHQCVFYYTY